MNFCHLFSKIFEQFPRYDIPVLSGKTCMETISQSPLREVNLISWESGAFAVSPIPPRGNPRGYQWDVSFHVGACDSVNRYSTETGISRGVEWEVWGLLPCWREGRARLHRIPCVVTYSVRGRERRVSGGNFNLFNPAGTGAPETFVFDFIIPTIIHLIYFSCTSRKLKFFSPSSFAQRSNVTSSRKFLHRINQIEINQAVQLHVSMEYQSSLLRSRNDTRYVSRGAFDYR